MDVALARPPRGLPTRWWPRSWEGAGFDLTTDTVRPEEGNFVPGPPLTRLCDATELPDSSRVLLDARDERRFKGIEDPIDSVAGHIPGAVCATFTDNLEGGKFLSPEALRQRFAALGVSGDVVCYCGSGVTAAHNILALLEAGLTSQRSIPIRGVDGLLTRHGQSPETDSGQWLYRSIISMGMPVGLVTWIERTIPNGGTLPSKTTAASPE